MNKELSDFAAHLCGTISSGGHCFVNAPTGQGSDEALPSKCGEAMFNQVALELFALQFKYNADYRKICEARKRTPQTVEHWTQIPAVPTSAFKELELSCLPPEERRAFFYSSGTTEQKPSRHFHCPASIELYEASLWSWFKPNVLASSKFKIQDLQLVCLTPPPAQTPHSSLVHMFEAVRQRLGAPESVFVSQTDPDGAWTLDFDTALAALNSSRVTRGPPLLVGTAFSFVHLLDFLDERSLRFQLPAGSRVMETGGYKNRSRTLPKEELHALITERLGIPRDNIICEYGMSELSSQAYDSVTSDEWRVAGKDGASRPSTLDPRLFLFPPWARVQIISPETGREVADGETGLIRIFDLANVFSVAAIQTEDLGVRRGNAFELLGRAQMAEQRGCSLMSA